MNIVDRIRELLPGAETAEQRIAKLVATERDLDNKLTEAEADLATAEANVGDEVLTDALSGDGSTATVTIGRTAFVRARVDALKRGIVAAVDARRRLVPEIGAEKAASMRTKAADLERKADDLEAEAKPFLDKLAEISGCAWSPSPPNRGPQMVGNLQGGAVGVICVPTPWWQIWRDEAAELRRAALAAENQPVVAHGTVEAATVEALIAAAHSNPMRIAPPAFVIREWARVALERARPTGAHMLNGRPLAMNYRFELVWRAGVIVTNESACRVQFSDSDYADEDSPTAA